MLEKDKLLSIQKDVAAIFNTVKISDQSDLLNLFGWSENTSISSGNDTINSIIKNICLSPKYKNSKAKI